MVERKAKKRDEKLEANGINRREWVAQAIALAGMHGTGKGKGKGATGGARATRRKPAGDRAEEE
jgi:hypothetical protein